MAQFRFPTYQRPLNSFDEMHSILGLIEPGRIRGFDTSNQTAPLDLELLHTTTGIKKTETPATTQTAQMGGLMSRQGMIISEDAAVPIAGFASNAANAFDRIDLIVCDHDYLASVGGQAAVYSIIQGANGGPVRPALTNDKIQIPIGEVLIPVSEANLNNHTYTPERVKGVGGSDIALQDKINIFTKTQSPGQGTDIDWTTHVDAGTGLLTLPSDGNLFKWADGSDRIIKGIAPIGKGTPITIYNGGGNKLTFNLFQAITKAIAKYPTGIFGDLFSSSLDIESGESVTLIETSGGYWMITESSSFLAKNSVLSVDKPLNTKTINLGDWDMDTSDSVVVAHGIGASFKKVKAASVIIRNDADTLYIPLSSTDKAGAVESNIQIGPTNITIFRTLNGQFDVAAYTTTSYNRGSVTITYEV